MKTVQISAVRRIVTNDANLVILELVGGKPAIVRTPEQFINDVNGSFITARELKSVNDPQFRRVLRDMKGATVSGDIKHVRAGEMWTVTENSQVITNKNAKGFGQYVVGDKKAYEKDATIVQDGFLTIELADSVYQREDNAQAYANAKVGAGSSFDITPDYDGGSLPEPIVVENDASGNTEDLKDITPELIEEGLGK